MGTYAMFRDAIESGDLNRIARLARQVGEIRLDDALRICLLLRDDPGERYERAAVRWLGRFALEGRGVTPADLRVALDALGSLPTDPQTAMSCLQALCVARGVGRSP
jgi:hypothetical protein